MPHLKLISVCLIFWFMTKYLIFKERLSQQPQLSFVFSAKQQMVTCSATIVNMVNAVPA